ncbi:T9SS type A sorting domain-containing protein [Fluviicola sp.]|uniref:T9SS type A sorting domain-containing protein n=1 Tax=Fluviicola sp. TaxID=1917219 RepID=UPI003D2DA372
MKKVLFILFACGVLSIAHSQIVSIPDANFKNYLLNHPGINTNSDNEIQVSEALNFTDSIMCPGMQIYDLAGIEAFENITFLSCVNNQLEGLDVSHNLALQDLICAMNHISSLDVSLNTNLRNLRCSINPIQSLDVSNNPNLEYLYCESNGLSLLDVSQNPDLIELYCTSNSIQTLDLTGHALLKRLDCSSNPLNQLDWDANNALEYIMCNGNQLSTISLEDCPALVEFRGVNGYYTQLNLSNCPNLKRFDCPFTQLTSLDFSNNPLLEVVYCFSSHLTSLNIANGTNPNLQLLWVSNNQLTCIQVDDAAYSTANWTGNSFAFDAGASFDEDCVAGLSILEKSTIEFYPNPTRTLVTIHADEKTSYKLMATDGTTIATGEFSVGNNVLNTESLSAGVYFFDCVGATAGRFIQKLQKIE